MHLASGFQGFGEPEGLHRSVTLEEEQRGTGLSFILSLAKQETPFNIVLLRNVLLEEMISQLEKKNLKTVARSLLVFTDELDCAL